MAALHHRPEIDDMRSAFDSASCQSDQDSERTSYNTSRSGSDRSYRTAATEHSQHSTKRPPRIHYTTCDGNHERTPQYFTDRQPQESPRGSVETFASTVASEEDVQEEIPAPDFDVPEYTQQQRGPAAVPATPADFSELFPSHRRLLIRHDDTTLDGNMNLRVDTEVNIRGQRRDMTLFHLRMHELREREFSLRRYCRDSGREVCHSSRKVEKPPMKRPGFQRSLSNALSTLRSKSDSRSPTFSSLKRNDSGYGSLSSSIDNDWEDRANSASATPKQPPAVTTNSIKLEFSNYAQVEIRRTGVKGSKRYEFEYWGVSYAWRRATRRDMEGSPTSYTLTKAGSERSLAHIITAALTPAQIEEERRQGGWIPPCGMRLEDESLVRGQKDVADVIVASGLIALVDDSIKTHFSTRQKLEIVGPKRFLSEIFKRETGSQTSHQSLHEQESRPSSRGTGTTSLRTPARAVSNVI
ncbi:hypothetical protein CB0940_04191 [Cercospora beticola]|uniref:Uncharacterized protein n=1 Tax=Cercospora beticola TaxID=122368 RepID=A0A2G5HKK6_CERBT|nr:hypothetical protein CB0940_04191 [Cercospora beticola]PIA93097.1 hypothetical protein CB0940_04191 [Cercospora beticola]WPB01409.1 hypothetical protein RHO25_006035 [Cercospora beticola]